MQTSLVTALYRGGEPAVYRSSQTLMHETASITLSNTTDTFTITGERTSFVESTTYTAAGYGETGGFASPLSALDTAAADAPVLDPGETLDLYLDILKRRVAYLLHQLAEMSSGEEDVPTGDLAVGAAQAPVEVLDILDPAYWSAENTAGRIVRFALSFYNGGDREEYAAMVRAAVMKGYDEAMRAWGGMLPQVSHDTIVLVNRALDSFAAGSAVDMSV